MQQLELVKNKVKATFIKRFIQILEGEEIDFTKLNYDDLVAIILSEDIPVLEDLSDDILDHEKLTYEEKMRLWQLIDERLKKEVGLL